MKFVKKLQIPNFRGIFMRNKLPKTISKNECGIINLDNYDSNGTHWTAYFKKGVNILYFDSYGNLRPPLELINYFLSNNKKNKIQYNYEQYQAYNSYNCGHLCLQFLYKNM